MRPRWFRVRLDETIGNFLRLIETWGTDPQFYVDLFNPCQSSNAAFVRWSGRYCRQSATAADILAQAMSFVTLDAADRLAEIAVPTLITHDVDDRVVPFAAGEWLATQIPGAIFKEMPGSDHFGLDESRLAHRRRRAARIHLRLNQRPADRTAVRDGGVHRHRGVHEALRSGG